MRKILSIVFIGLMVCAALFACGCTGSQPSAPTTPVATEETGESLLVYCGAGLREPMDEIASLYEERYGVQVNYNFGGSAQLLSQIGLYQNGDVYMPGATYYFDAAREKGFVSEERLVAYHIPIIAVPKGNPAGITCLADLATPGVKVELGDPDACAIGKLSEKILEKNGIKEEVLANVQARAATVNELLVHVSMGVADAAIIWEDLYNDEKMDAVAIPKEQNIVKVIPIGTITFSKNPDAALNFIEFVASDDGKAVFEKHGFTT
ncbi:MAG: molybdate ABC transporter substrate-binding protein [Methanoculleaceae archaeon]